MPATAALYLNDTDIDFGLHFKEVKEEGLCCGLPEVLHVDLGGKKVRFDLLHGKAMAEHVAAFSKFIETMEGEDEAHQAAAVALLDDVAIVLKLVTDEEWTDEMWAAVADAGETLDALLFAFESVIMPSGLVLVGPLRKQTDSIRASFADDGDGDGE